MKKNKILVVEDENDLCELIAEKLKAAGYDVYTAANGEEGLTSAKAIRPGCIISDVIMPKMDGNKMIKALRESDFGRDIPVIVLTARAKMRDYFEVAEVAGFIDKPFRTEELVAKIEEVLADKKAGIELKGKLPPQPQVKEDIVLSAEIEPLVNTRMMEGLSMADDLPERSFQKRGNKRAADKSVKKIMIVDETSTGRELEKSLAQHGCVIKVVPTPVRCLAELSQFLPDIILTKFILAEMNADAMVGIIKQMPFFEKVPIVIYGNISRPKGDPDAQEDGEESAGFNAEGYEVLRKVSELLDKLKTNPRGR